ncbi:MAG: TrmJ/YjtD family RNA methyltransferase [Proteobacteria bacterium]|nr:TrmJ/YjtD family RNA methyltransferase [Pseudomonadota bacterium]
MTALDRFCVVLVEPLYGGNLGSVARVMANFGLSRLALVNPAPGALEDPGLAPMARTAVDLAREAPVLGSLEEALADVELALGFTTRLGRRRRDGLDLRPAMARVAREAPSARVAAVFGREDKGLTNAELERCHWLVRIASHRNLPSLNLAQAVGVFCYEAAQSLGATTGLTAPKPATVGELEGLYDHAERVLLQIGFIEEASPARMMNEVRRILSRRLPEPRDVRILRGVLAKVELALERAREGPER